MRPMPPAMLLPVEVPVGEVLPYAGPMNSQTRLALQA
jgi:hypothetical protein